MENFILYLKAAIMGVVEGLTEFLPVSSTGHLILTENLIGFNVESTDFFEFAIQAGAIFAICILYAKKFYFVATHVASDRQARKFIYNIVLAFIPAVVLGLLFHDVIKIILFSPYVVSIALIVGGVIIIFAEKIEVKAKYFSVEKIPYRKIFLIGLLQCLAMIPGVSRSGATIISARLLGTTRRVAAEFSFFLAIPTIGGAAAYDIYKNFDQINHDTLILLLIGLVTSFITALLVVKSFLRYIKKHDFSIFGWYRIVVGLIMLALLLKA